MPYLYPDEQLVAARLLMLLDEHAYHEKAQRLLRAMLWAIEVDWQQVAVVSLAQIKQLPCLPVDKNCCWC